ncbi:MAG: histidine kinase [Enterobacterales bacterium]|nr:histidine kinase [Enterobacterales bacterium]
MNKSSLQTFFLPDFCRVESVLMVVLVGELLAVIFTMLALPNVSNNWQLLGLYSISIQCISLPSVLILCLFRPTLARLSDIVAGFLSLMVILSMTFVYSNITLVYYYGGIFDLTEELQRQFFIKNLVVAGLIGSVLLRYFYLQQQYRKQIALESSARLEALQARIRPHFLFNSMNVIASLTRIDPRKAETAIEDLSDLIRATLDNKNELIHLKTELENGKKYLSIEVLRLGERLAVNWQVDDDCLSVMVPPLSVQPLLENAVYHGIQMVTKGGAIDIKIHKDDHLLFISVANPKQKNVHHKGQGIALNNISQRLEVLFGERAKLERKSTDSSYQVTMSIPLKRPLNTQPMIFNLR